MLPLAPPAIVLADDDTDDLFFAMRALAKAGLSGPIATCVNGREVLALLQERNAAGGKPWPDVVILDVKMPVMSGFETLRWIRAQESLAQVAVIMLSGSNEARDTALASELGADGYLVKYPAGEEIARVISEGRERRRR